MPNFDKTGPEGKGPMTGRGLGDCAGASGRPFFGRGACPRGRMGGRGLGLRRASNSVDEKKN